VPLTPAEVAEKKEEMKKKKVSEDEEVRGE
jgi:hypothetical protein